jgi:hypothetical protein
MSMQERIYKAIQENDFEFIRNNLDKVDWDYISAYRELSENFIREFQDKVNWYRISEYQSFTEDFIGEFYDRIEWGVIPEYQQKLKQKLKFVIKSEAVPQIDNKLVKVNEKLAIRPSSIDMVMCSKDNFGKLTIITNGYCHNMYYDSQEERDGMFDLLTTCY